MPYPSDATPEKQRFYRKFLGMHIAMAKGPMDREGERYYYIDMNAADGTGSPAIFDEEAQRLNLPYRAALIEQDRTQYEQLRNRFGAAAIHGDHDLLLPAYCKQLCGHPFGLIYHDPFKAAASFDTLRQASAIPGVRRIDILIRFQAKLYKFVRTVHDHKYKSLAVELDVIDKGIWFIRRQEDNASGWTFLYGTNFPPRNWRKEHFYRFDSPEGKDIFDYCAYTEGERRERYGQLTLPFV